MKKTTFFLLLSLFTAGAFASGNFEGNQKKKKKAKTAMKAHVCTNACKSGTHMYLHGEKGHTCGEACMKPKM
ncbi:hypothetical protein [Ferruginibacter sp.]|nr:hypothetical protein [Ferruginibacter sp.]